MLISILSYSRKRGEWILKPFWIVCLHHFHVELQKNIRVLPSCCKFLWYPQSPQDAATFLWELLSRKASLPSLPANTFPYVLAHGSVTFESSEKRTNSASASSSFLLTSDKSWLQYGRLNNAYLSTTTDHHKHTLTKWLACFAIRHLLTIT